MMGRFLREGKVRCHRGLWMVHGREGDNADTVVRGKALSSDGAEPSRHSQTNAENFTKKVSSSQNGKSEVVVCPGEGVTMLSQI
jgi:hypothetical protein